MVNGLDRDPEDVDSGDLCQDLATVLSRRPPDEFDAARERMVPAMIAYSAVHQEFGEAWRHRVMEPSRVCLRRILRRGIKRGQLPATFDFDAGMALPARPRALRPHLPPRVPTRPLRFRPTSRRVVLAGVRPRSGGRWQEAPP